MGELFKTSFVAIALILSVDPGVIALARPTVAGNSTAVLAGEVMDVGTTQGVPSVAVSLPGILGGWTVAAKHIHSHGDDLKVLRVHASCVHTQMVDGEVVRDRPVSMFIDPACSPEGFPTVSEAAVSVLVEVRSPLVTPAVGVHNNLLAEPVNRGTRWSPPFCRSHVDNLSAMKDCHNG